MTVDVEGIAARLARWVDTRPPLAQAPLDPATEALCRRKLGAWAAPGVLAAKLARELPAPWEPLGRLLLVISEHDVVGTLAGVVAGVLTGNQVRVKARATAPLVRSLVAALALPASACEVLDWHSSVQDDAAVLADIDGVLIAGDDATLRHYRKAAQPGVRLIEFGHRVGIAAVAGPVAGQDELERLAQALCHDATVFGGSVCSTPQWVLVERPEVAERLYAALCARLAQLPPLPSGERWPNLVRARELALLSRLGTPVAAECSPASGWGVTLGDRLDPARRLPRGIALVAGPLPGQFEALARAHRHQRQTLGTWGPVPEAPGYTHRCPIGRMHERLPGTPHDGFFELAALVRFTSREDAA